MADRAKELEEKRKRLAELRQANQERKVHAPNAAGSNKSVEAILSELSTSEVPHASHTSDDAHVVHSPVASHSAGQSMVDTVAKRGRLAVHVLPSSDVKPKVTEVYSKSSGTDLEIPVDKDVSKLIDMMLDENYSAPAHRDEDAPRTAAQPATTPQQPTTPNKAAEEPKPADEKPKLTEVPPAERKAILASEDFQDFFARTTRVMERALAAYTDVAVDYSIGGANVAVGSGSATEVCSLACKFFDEKRSKHRPLTAVDWSPKHPELLLGAYYSKTEAGGTTVDADGIVLLWSTMMQARPEYEFKCQSAVTAAKFSPFSPSLIVGGTYSGQIVLWDTREKSAPVQRTPLTSSGHSHPVYCMDIVGSTNAHSLVSISTDGRMCVWNLAMLSRPQETIELVAPSVAHSSGANRPTRELGTSVSTTALAFADSEVNNFFIGAEDGAIWSGSRHGSGVGVQRRYESHFGPVTSLHFHPSTGPTDFGDLFLSSSVDWTSRLGSLKQTKPLATFEASTDYVYDAQWSPTHPAVFATGDGSGQLDIWNLNHSVEMPLERVRAADRAISRIKWSQSGRQIVAGDSSGCLTLFNVVGDIADAKPEEWRKFSDVLKNHFEYGSAALEEESGFASADAPAAAQEVA